MFAKFDEIPSLPVQDIKEKPRYCRLRITKAVTLKELAPSPYFSTINVHLVDINVFVKFYEIPSLPFPDTLQSLYNATCYNTVLVITRPGLGSQMVIFL